MHTYYIYPIVFIIKKINNNQSVMCILKINLFNEKTICQLVNKQKKNADFKNNLNIYIVYMYLVERVCCVCIWIQ